MTTEIRPAATAPTGRPTGEARQGRPGPQLALVEAPSRRPVRLRRAVLTAFGCVLVATLFAVGLIQAQLVQRQQHLDELRTEIADARAQELRLAREVLVASSPDEVVRRATEMGMVRAQDPVYLVAVRPVAEDDG
jgi:cell division protein FtsL